MTITPGVTPWPDSAIQQPVRKTPSCATAPAVDPTDPRIEPMRSLRHLAVCTRRLFLANRSKASRSAWKLFTTEKPLSPSFNAATYAAFSAETLVSAFASRGPSSIDTASGSAESTSATRASGTLYQNIMASAPANSTASPQNSNIFCR